MATEPSRNKIGFGERLKAARADKKFTGEQFGKGLAVDGKDASKQTISDWEGERHLPNVWQLREMCLRLGVSADFLLFGQGGMTPAMVDAHAALSRLSASQRQAVIASVAPMPTQSEAAAGYQDVVEKSKSRDQRKPAAKRAPKKRKKPE